jgi:predicted lactoylglutathione lyase
MSTQIFVNLPVRDLKKATVFYTALGAVKNPQFSDETVSCMVFSDTIFVMLLTHEKWRLFTKKPIADARRESEVMLALSADSRKAVDRITEAAGANGGRVDVNPKQDHGLMYRRSFEDLDRHIWEPMFVDISQIPGSG